MADGSDLTIVYGFRDREVGRVKRSLDSLKAQSVKGFRVIFVDYGSNSKRAREIEELINSYTFCEYIFSDSRGLPWNRAKALNPGIKAVDSEYTMTTDVDMIFCQDFVKNALKKVSKRDIIYCRWNFLPEKFSDWQNIDLYQDKLSKSSKGCLGGCCIVNTDILKRINGFDETFCFWGLEDNDLNIRLKKSGLNELWIESKDTYIFHQWHSVANSVTPNFMPSGLWGMMVDHMYRNQDNACRNLTGWGEILKERPVFEFISPEGEIKEERLRKIYKYCPVRGYEESQVTDNVIADFHNLKSGEAIGIDNSTFPTSTRCMNYVFFFINKVLWKLGVKSAIDYRKNELHSGMFGFIRNNSDIISDYFWGRACGSDYLVIIKR